MASKKKAHGDGGGHGGAWVITFADLVSLLMAFFVMIVSFSVQDEQKVAQAAGSIRDAFGVQPIMRPGGIVEIDGVPVRKYVRDMGALESQAQGDSQNATPYRKEFGNTDLQTRDFQGHQGDFNAVVAALQAAMNSNPDMQDAAGNIVMEATDEGLNISVMDSDSRSMFGLGSTTLTETARLVLAQFAPVLDAVPNTIRVVGHSSTDPAEMSQVGQSVWELSAARAESARSVLAEYGLSPDHFAAIVGMGDSQPMLPDNPTMAGNRRVTILLERSSSPYPSGMKP